ncbi:MAG TPA: hypothetical protein VNO81_09125, partial [Candidatus Nitrosotenuis sp.]|nr:hypothetical protein [Candidatus Nitrosotenuis sp.]
MAGSRPNPQTWFLLFALLTTLAWPAGAQPAPIVQGSYTVAGLQLVPSNNTWRNNMQGELSLPFQSSPVPMTFQLSPDGGKVVSGFITASFPIQVKGFTFTLQDSIYDAQHDRFVADAVLTGPELPERLLAKRVVWDRTGILEVGELTSKYWNLAHELWQIGQGE